MGLVGDMITRHLQQVEDAFFQWLTHVLSVTLMHAAAKQQFEISACLFYHVLIAHRADLRVRMVSDRCVHIMGQLWDLL